MAALIKNNPITLIEIPKVTLKIPDVLDDYKIDLMLTTSELYIDDATRNHAITITITMFSVHVYQVPSF